MFEKLLKTLKVDLQKSSMRLDRPSNSESLEYHQLLLEAGGQSFEKGLYRIIEINATERWKRKLYGAYPDYQNKLLPFAYDWLNRVYCVEVDSQFGLPQCLLVSHITDEVLRIPFGVKEFHNEVLLENIDDILEPNIFEEFLLQSRSAMLHLDECASFERPLFLGGSYEVKNMKIADIEVDWEVTLQLLSQTRDLKPGSAILSVDRSD